MPVAAVSSETAGFNSAAVCDCGELSGQWTDNVEEAASIRPQSVTAENVFYVVAAYLSSSRFNSAAVCDCGEPPLPEKAVGRAGSNFNSAAVCDCGERTPSTFCRTRTRCHFNSAAVCDCGERGVEDPQDAEERTSIRPQSVTAENAVPFGVPRIGVAVLQFGRSL